MRLQFLQFLLFLYTACHLAAHANVFEKYINLKRALKARAALPARRPLARAQSPLSTGGDVAKSEHAMRAAMLAKPRNATRRPRRYASGHTFLPSVVSDATRRAPNATRASPTPARRDAVAQPPRAVRWSHGLSVEDAVVGQGGRGAHRVSRDARAEGWFASKVARVVVVALVVWACAIASRKSGARRKARVLKKRLTNPRMMA